MSKKVKMICIIVFIVIIIGVIAIIAVNANNKRREEELQNRIEARLEDKEYSDSEEEIPNIDTHASIDKDYYLYFYGGQSKNRKFLYVYLNKQNDTKKYKYIYADTERISKENIKRNVIVKETGEVDTFDKIIELAKEYKCATAVHKNEIYLLATIQKMVENEEI